MEYIIHKNELICMKQKLHVESIMNASELFILNVLHRDWLIFFANFFQAGDTADKRPAKIILGGDPVRFDTRTTLNSLFAARVR